MDVCGPEAEEGVALWWVDGEVDEERTVDGKGAVAGKGKGEGVGAGCVGGVGCRVLLERL